MLKLTFLGTGTSQGVPVIGCDCPTCRSEDRRDRRLRSSVVVENEDTRVVIDAGPDFRYQMLRAKISQIDAILLTHEHKDHIAGIDDIRAFNYMSRAPIPIYATERVAGVIRKDYDYAFAPDRYPRVPQIDLRIIDTDRPFNVKTMGIIPVSGGHSILPVTGFRIGELAYLTDFNHIRQSELDKVKGVEALIINALRFEKHISHYSVDEAVEIGRQVGARQIYLTHVSHEAGVYAVIDRRLPEGVHFAYDKLEVIID